MVSVLQARMPIGKKIDRVATKKLTHVVDWMAKHSLGGLAVTASTLTGLLAMGVGYDSWEAGSSLHAVAEQRGYDNYMGLMNAYSSVDVSYLSGQLAVKEGAFLERAHVIAIHKLVSFHAAFISSLLSLPDTVSGKAETLKFVFLSAETAISTAMTYLSWHAGIAIHEMGHYLTAVKLTALNDGSRKAAEAVVKQKGIRGVAGRLAWYTRMFVQIPWGKFEGVKKEGGNFSPDAPYNLAVAAAGPVWSGIMAAVALPVAALSIGLGLYFGSEAAILVGRFFLAPGCVGLCDRFLADRGKVAEFKAREAAAKEASASVSREVREIVESLKAVKAKLIGTRMKAITLPDGSVVSAPWQWRNCAMGGCHTEKEYPESNISMQEGMFIPLSAKSYEEAQEMTVKLQTRLKQIIENATGGRVMGIGLEGGLAPYVEKAEGDLVPEQRVWRMMKQAIEECGYVPGEDVAIALDPAASELENAYRTEFEKPDSVGMYLFWRDGAKVVMSREEVLDLYKTAIERDGVPIVSIEDGFGERDHEGWALLMRRLGDKILVIGDDLVTTKDSNIEKCAKEGIMNATLIKANQIGTISETILAMLTSLAYKCECVVSHRSKSPNDSLEAEFAAAFNTVGMKAGGGSNTERLQKYGRIVQILALAQARPERVMTPGEKTEVLRLMQKLLVELTGREDVELKSDLDIDKIKQLFNRMYSIEAVLANEASTNAGIPTVEVTLMLDCTGTIRYTGATPLGTSAGEDEAIHLVDSVIRPSSLTEVRPDMFTTTADGTLRFKKQVKRGAVEHDADLLALWSRAHRFGGKGCLTAVANVEQIISKAFEGKLVTSLGGVTDVDTILLSLERDQALADGALAADADYEQQVHVMQRKGHLGMNAILSTSLALGRAIAASQGKELWQLIRERGSETMARFIASNTTEVEKRDWRTNLVNMSLQKLIAEMQTVAKQFSADERQVFEALRAEMPIYRVPEGVATRYLFASPKIVSQLQKADQEKLTALGQLFKPEGSVTFDVEIRDGKSFLRVREGSKRGLGESYLSRAESKGDGREFSEGRDAKAQTIIDGTVFVDDLAEIRPNVTEFAGKRIVCIPHRTGDKGTITVLIGEFNESLPVDQKLAILDQYYDAVKRYTYGRHDKTPEIRQAIRDVLGALSIRHAFERNAQHVYKEHILPILQERDLA